MRTLALVVAGGAAGTAARYGLVLLAARVFGPGPQGTLLVNLLGCFAMGALVSAWAAGRVPDAAQVPLASGLLGGFTTYSAFNQGVLDAAASGRPGLAVGYLFATLVGCLLAGAAGLAAGRALF